MGHLINPLSFRLGVNSFWNSTWNVTNFHKYNHVIFSDKFIIDYVNWSLAKIYKFKFKLQPFCVKLYRTKNVVFINIYNQYLGKSLNLNNDWFKFRPNNAFKISYQVIYKLILSYFWEIFNKKIQFFLEKANNVKHLKFSLNVYYSSKYTISPKLITDNMIKKLNSGFSLSQVINPVTWNLERKIGESFISGYKLLYAGRFTRKQIATFSWISRGYSKLNSPSTVVKYSADKTILKFGACGIKLWLTFKNNYNYLEGYDLIFPFNKSSHKMLFKKGLSFQNLFFNLNSINFYRNNKNDSYYTFLTWYLNKNVYKLKKNLFIVRKKKSFFSLNTSNNLNIFNFFEHSKILKNKNLNNSRKLNYAIRPIFKPIFIWKGKTDDTLRGLIINNYRLKGRFSLYYISKKSRYFTKLLNIKPSKGVINHKKKVNLTLAYE